MTSFSLNFFSNQIQCSHVFLIIRFAESSNLKRSYFITNETRDFPCIPVLPEIFRRVRPFFNPPWLDIPLVWSGELIFLERIHMTQTANEIRRYVIQFDLICEVGVRNQSSCFTRFSSFFKKPGSHAPCCTKQLH